MPVVRFCRSSRRRTCSRASAGKGQAYVRCGTVGAALRIFCVALERARHTAGASEGGGYEPPAGSMGRRRLCASAIALGNERPAPRCSHTHRAPTCGPVTHDLSRFLHCRSGRRLSRVLPRRARAGHSAKPSAGCGAPAPVRRIEAAGGCSRRGGPIKDAERAAAARERQPGKYEVVNGGVACSGRIWRIGGW